MLPITPQECSRIAQDLQIRKVQVESVVQLLDEGNTVPFITRYRKERTGGLQEDAIRQIQSRVQFLRQLQERKQTILKTITNQGRLTDDLRQAILGAETTKRLEDLYLPYKPKKRSLATTARERGLEPLAHAIWYSDPAVGNLDEMLSSLVNPEKELKTVDDVRTGVGHLLSEMMAESAEIRAPVRSILWELGGIQSTKSDKLQEGQGNEFKNYFQFKELVRQIPPHRILALNRGEKEHAVKVGFEWPKDKIAEAALIGLSEVLLKRAGQTPPAPPPPRTRAAETAPAAPDAPAADAVDSTVSPSPPEGELSPSPEMPPEGSDVAPPAPPEPAPIPEAAVAPLVASLPTSPPPVLTGEQLAPGGEFRSPHVGLLKAALDDAINRLLLPSLEREIRHELTEEAEQHAVQVFARNLRSLLLQPPLRGKRVLAIDPGFRTGCKVAALDEYGNLLDHSVIYPFTPAKKSKGRGERGKPAAESAPPPIGEAAPGEAPSAPETAAVEAPANGEAPIAPGALETPMPTEPPVAPAGTGEPLAPSSEAPEATAPPTDAPAADAAPPTDTPVADAATPVAETPAAPEPPPVDPKIEAKNKLLDLIRKHGSQVIALGNGTGCRETEEIIAELIGTSAPEVAYIVVNEAGASVYSVSPVGREEFPNFDATTRGTISIGRRLQDPLSELVKVDPQSIGVGLYQHDMSRKELKESLEAVVESSVNQVGVDLNTASVPLLRHISGLNQLVARELVEYRKTNGAFASREQLMSVPSFGPARFTQAAGFLKIPSAPNPLDRTWIHPESYAVAEKLLGELGYGPNVLDESGSREEFHGKLRGVNVEEMSRKLGTGGPTLHDILDALLKPGRDPREDLPPPIFKKGILRIEDLQPNMELRGTVLNVVDFGAFVDIGLKDSGLVHISQMANRYIKSPYDVVAVNDVVTVWVKSIDAATRHVSLTMIKPGTEQKPPERRPGGGRPAGGERRPPRGPRRSGPPQQAGAGQQGPPSVGGNQPAGQENRGPRDPRGGPPGRGGPRPPRAPYQGGGRGPQQGGPPPGEQSRGPANPPPPQTPPPPPRPPRKELPKPKLSKEALEGKVPLRTFRELSALFAAKTEPVEAPKPAPKPEPKPEAATPTEPPASSSNNSIETSTPGASPSPGPES